MAFLLKFQEDDVTPIGLDIVSLPDKNAAYMPPDDIRLSVEKSEPNEIKMPEREQEAAHRK
jgi:hypothetical protein